MDEKARGAWIVHHERKLEDVSNVHADFDEISFAGKCSTILSAISQTKQATLSRSRVDTLAKAAGISVKVELPTLLNELERQRLISVSTTTGIEVLALTSATILEHTSRIFKEAGPTKGENAVLEISERVSEAPLLLDQAREFVSDTFKMDAGSTADLLRKSKSIGFFDCEELRDGKEIVFNGNLFRNEDVNKVARVIGALTSSESKSMKEANELLRTHGCVPVDEVVRIMGQPLFDKLHSIGIYDVSTVSNEEGKYNFVTRPTSFCKYTKSLADDAFDLAKAFVTSLTYGMVNSQARRGRIRMVEALMQKLLSGLWVGPATAIGEDYKVLELRGVIQTKPALGGMYMMRLLKRDVGELAALVVAEGEATTNVLPNFPGASVSAYEGPERNRTIKHKNIAKPLLKGVRDLLDSLRTGEL